MHRFVKSGSKKIESKKSNLNSVKKVNYARNPQSTLSSRDKYAN